MGNETRGPPPLLLPFPIFLHSPLHPLLFRRLDQPFQKFLGDGQLLKFSVYP